MAHLIDKDALLAEIEKRIKAIPRGETDKRLKAVYGNEVFVLHDLFSFIDSMQEEPVSEQNLSNVESTGKNWEEPVSEEMWEASKQYALRQVLASTDTEMSEQGYLSLRLFSGFELAVAHKDGANWQKEQILGCNTTLQRTFELGKQEMKQQLIAKAVDAIAMPNDDEIWCELKSFDLKEGDKVKVIVIKEDRI